MSATDLAHDDDDDDDDDDWVNAFPKLFLYAWSQFFLIQYISFHIIVYMLISFIFKVFCNQYLPYGILNTLSHRSCNYLKMIS